MNNFLECLKEVNLVHSTNLTKQQLEECISLMSPESKKIFEARWGLDKLGTYCPNHMVLNQKLQVENSWILYHRALSELDLIIFKFSYAQILIDYSKDFDLAFCYGTFLARILNHYCHPQELDLSVSIDEMHKRFDKAFKSLTALERKVIIVKYGLEDSLCIKLDSDVSQIVKKSVASIIKAEKRAIKKLQRPKMLAVIKG